MRHLCFDLLLLFKLRVQFDHMRAYDGHEKRGEFG